MALGRLEQAIWQGHRDGHHLDLLVHHSDHAQYLSIAYTERLHSAGIEASVGTVGDSYDNAAAEALNRLYRKELTGPRSPWTGLDDVEYATLEWVDWYTTADSTAGAATSRQPNTKPSTTLRTSSRRQPDPAQNTLH